MLQLSIVLTHKVYQSFNREDYPSASPPSSHPSSGSSIGSGSSQPSALGSSSHGSGGGGGIGSQPSASFSSKAGVMNAITN